MTEPVWRFCIRVSANPGMPSLNPGAIQGACSRCRHRVWVDAAQEMPEFLASSPMPLMPLCMECCLADPEIRPHILETIMSGIADLEAGKPVSVCKDGQPWDGSEKKEG